PAAESGSSSCGLVVHLPLLSTSPRGDAVTFGYEVQTQPRQGLAPCGFVTITGARVRRFIAALPFSPFAPLLREKGEKSKAAMNRRTPKGPTPSPEAERGSRTNPQTDGCQPASAHSSPLTAELPIRKQIASAISSGRMSRCSCV